jgi:hypothetical protein
MQLQHLEHLLDIDWLDRWVSSVTAGKGGRGKPGEFRVGYHPVTLLYFRRELKNPS